MKSFLFYTLVFLIYSTGHALNELESVNNPLTLIKAAPVSSKAAPEQRIPISLSLKLAEGFHGYQDKFKIFALRPDGTQIGDILLKPTVTFTDFTKKLHVGFENEFSAEFFIEFPKDQPSILEKLEFDIEYVACTEKFCLPRNRIHISIPIVPSAPASTTENATESSFSSSFSIEEHIQQNLPFALLIIFIFGFLTSLTPCVYPLIPITLAVVGARSQKSSKLKSFSLSCFYVLGIATTYSLLGVLAAKTGSLFGQALSYPWVIITFSILFFVMALGIFGIFEIALPTSLTQKFQNAGGSKSALGAYTAGLIAGIVASPCVGPVLVGVLAYIAKTQSLILGFILLFTFALGMGVLFIALGTFSSLLHKVPKSGPWMNLVKFVLGAMLLGVSLYYLSPLLKPSQYNFALGIYLTIALGFLFYLTQPKSKIQTGFFILVCVGSLYGAHHKLLKQEKLPPSQDYDSSQSVEEDDEWQDFSEELLAKAKAEGKPVMIDFYADWCGACVELEEKTFPTAIFKEATKDFYLLRVDATEHFDGLDELNKRFNVYGLPTLIFIDKEGNFKSDLSLTGFEEAEQLVVRIKNLNQK